MNISASSISRTTAYMKTAFWEAEKEAYCFATTLHPTATKLQCNNFYLR